jgi:hypothetical protein
VTRSLPKRPNDAGATAGLHHRGPRHPRRTTFSHGARLTSQWCATAILTLALLSCLAAGPRASRPVGPPQNALSVASSSVIALRTLPFRSRWCPRRARCEEVLEPGGCNEGVEGGQGTDCRLYRAKSSSTVPASTLWAQSSSHILCTGRCVPGASCSHFRTSRGNVQLMAEST